MSFNEMELDRAPAFDLEQKVKTRKVLRNDGTFPGKDIGYHLAKKGEVGYVVGIGTYLQTSYIYSVHFIESGFIVGCLGKELETVPEAA